MTGQSKNKVYIAACYERLSVDDSLYGTSESIETQIKILEDYCRNHEIVISDHYYDDGYTGTNFERPHFKKMIADARAGKFNTIIVKDASRFARNVNMATYTEELFPSLGIRFISIGDDFDSAYDDASTNFGLQCKMLFNQYYPAECSRKVKDALRIKASRGEYVGSCAPYGMRKCANDRHRLEPDEETAPIVQRIFRMIAYEGCGYSKIARIFEKEEILTPNAYREVKAGRSPGEHPYAWNLGSVSMIVHNRAYIGDLVSRKRSVISYKTKKVRKNDPEDWIVVEGIFPALISRQTWEDAQSAVQVRKREGDGDGFNIFAGLLRCADCGRILGFGGRKQTTPYYCCENYKKHGKEACTPHHTLYKDVYESVLKDLKLVIGKVQKTENVEEAAAKMLYAQQDKEAELQRRMSELTARQEKIRKECVTMYQDRLNGVITTEQFKLFSDGNAEKLKTLREAEEKMRAELERIRQSKETFEEFFERVKAVGKIRGLNKELLNTFISSIEVSERKKLGNTYEQDIVVHYRFEEVCVSK